jgi:hypothetical protein
VPVTLRVIVLAVLNVHVSVEVPEPLESVIGLNVQAELLDVSATFPVNPFTGDRVIVEVPAEFTGIVTDVGLAEIPKSGCDDN